MDSILGRAPALVKRAHVYTHATGLAGADGFVALGSWGEMVPLGPDEATFERFEMCWLES